MKKKLLTSNDFHNEWEKIGKKHDKIINCCGIPKLERRWHTREKISNYETDLQQLLNKVNEAKHIAEEKIMNSLHPYEDFKRDDETEALLQLSHGIYRDVHSVQEDRVGVEEFMEIDDSEIYPDDWIPICRREDECCKKTKNHQSSKWINDGKSVDLKWEKTKKEDCYFCNF
jgi:hypothetical protein